jgi:uncharacterized protein YchJ
VVGAGQPGWSDVKTWLTPVKTPAAKIDDRDARIRALHERRNANPEDAEASFELANLYFEKERSWHAEALAAYREAVKKDPAYRSNPVLLRNVVSMLDHDEATREKVRAFRAHAARRRGEQRAASGRRERRDAGVAEAGGAPPGRSLAAALDGAVAANVAAVTCPCGTSLPLERCCGLYLGPEGAPAPTAETLMRSRYTAYVTGDIDHIVRTQDEAGGDVDREAIEKFSRESEWLGLEIVATEAGGEGDEKGMVEFVARYRPKTGGGGETRHHERSPVRQARRALDLRLGRAGEGGAGAQGAYRRAQRSVSLWQRQEVQALPWSLRNEAHAGGFAPRRADVFVVAAAVDVRRGAGASSSTRVASARRNMRSCETKTTVPS